MKKSFAQRLQTALEIRGLKQIDLVEKTNISKSAISQYLSGDFEPKQSNTYKLAQALHVNEAWLMGYDDVPMDPQINPFTMPNISPLKIKKVPLLGEIAAGIPILAEERTEDYIECQNDLPADFCLKIKGNSMFPRLQDGDLVFIHQQQDVENGEIAAVYVDGEATLKRIYKTPNSVQLISENPEFAPIIYSNSNCSDLKILGKAIAYQRSL